MIIEQKLPPNWTVVKFGESCIFSQGIQVDVNLQSEIKKSNQVRFLRIVDFTQGDDPPRYIDNPGDKYFLEKDEIAMVRYGTVGFVCTGKEGVIANNLFKIVPSEYLTKAYLINFLKSLLFKNKLESKGATMQALSFGLINPIEIPLPPIPEQQRIVFKIEELFIKLDKGIETLKTAKQQLKVYRQAVLKYAFEGRLTNPEAKEGELPEGWEKSTFGRECDFSQGIQVDVGLQSEIKGDTQVRFLRIVDFTKGDEPPRYIDHPGERYFLCKDEIAMVRYGTVGFVCTGKEGVIANNLFKILPSVRMSNKYLIHFLQSDLFRSKLESKGATMQALSFGLIKPISMPVPTIKEQMQIVQEIESRLSVCDKIEESIEQGLQQAEALRQSILKKAFEGKLVPQDPNDEPASVLLERIKAERAVLQPVNKTKTKKVNT
jgi:type I restriction enzyme S subunit